MLVVDTSAVVAALAGRPRLPELNEQLASDGDLHAPHLIDVEFIHVIRRLVRNGDLAENQAEDCRADFANLAITRYPHHPLLSRMWELRHNLTAYDAAFVSLSEALGAPLVTCDARLAGSLDHYAPIRLFDVH